MRKMLVISLSVAALSLAACAKEEKAAEKPGAVAGKAHSAAPAPGKVQGFVGVIKDARLAALPSNTVGGAFDSYRYFDTRDWNEARVGNKAVIDFYGKLKDSTLSGRDREGGVIGRGLNVKFVINPDGSYAVASIVRYDSREGGKVEGYPVADFGSVLPKIYANETLVF